jgi:hypothetical protein
MTLTDGKGFTGERRVAGIWLKGIEVDTKKPKMHQL